jgi:hypothetical protein
MRFTDIDLFGVYVAPISLLMVLAWFIAIGLRRVVDCRQELMDTVETKANAAPSESAPMLGALPLQPSPGRRPRRRILPLPVTLVAVALRAGLGWQTCFL